MALGTFRPGEYQMTYAGVNVGLITSGGEHLRFRPKKKKIDDTATYGDTLIDGIYRGLECRLQVTFKEWIAPVKQAIYPYSAAGAPGGFDGTLGVIGRLDSDLAQQIVLTAVSGTPAALNGPATLTAAKAILSDANDIDMLFGPDETDLPVLFDLLLYDDAGTKRVFKLT
jgi:hypothetical protein